MQIMGTGVDYTTGKLLVEAFDEQLFADEILDSLGKNFERIQDLTDMRQVVASFKGEVKRKPTIDLGNPQEAGWTYLLNRKQPELEQIIEALRPLAKHRCMSNPNSPLFFHDEAEDEWITWMQKHYSMLDTGELPHYILIVGGPDNIPFGFQSFLDSIAFVGRVDFDSLEYLKTYVQKIIRLETENSRIVERETIFFAPNGGRKDPTYYSRHYMAKPLADHVKRHHKFRVTQVFGDQATRKEFVSALIGAKPALIYSASHGAVAPLEKIDIQKKIYGAICCQPSKGDKSQRDRLFSADDVPSNEPFLEGAIFFQFACFGYGNPAKSDFAHWRGKQQLNAKHDFVSSLPKKLLCHPKGPIAYIGHVDKAWLHGFIDDPKSPIVKGHWDRRIEPFVSAIGSILDTQPVGLALEKMNKNFDLLNWSLTDKYDRIMRGDQQVTPDFQKELTDIYIRRNDAQNYMVFGDPAVRLRIPQF